MRRIAKTYLVIGCLQIAITAVSVRAAELQAPSVDIAADPIAAKLAALGKEYARLAKVQLEVHPDLGNGGQLTDETVSDEEFLRHALSAETNMPDPDAEMLPRLFEFARNHPDSPFALDALCEVVHRGGPQTGNVQGKPWQIKEQALDVVWDNHKQDPRMVHLLKQLGGSLPSHKTEALLKRAFEQGPDKSVRAAAAFHLARYYHTLAGNHQRSKSIKDKPHLLNWERFWKIIVTPYLEKNFPLDEEKNAAEIERLLALVIEEYADVPAMNVRGSGPGGIFLNAVPVSPPKTYGDLAQSLLFEVNNIVRGKPAPEIEGIGADGKQFRLSDYRGKVVLLTFSANWCGSCVELYPLQRNLAEKFRDQPFVILSVSRDDEIETLKASVAAGEITWPCWWDGHDGPIRRAWNNGGVPALLLLDHEHIFQNVAVSRFSSQQEFEQALEPLLQKAAARNVPASR